MLFDYDILIAGAGPAGCAAAYDLARAGRRVLLLDRRSFPRPKACACGLTRKTLKALRYSVDPVVERVCHEIVLQRAPEIETDTETNTETRADKSLEVRIRSRNPICAMAVRDRFDEFCLHQTLAAGAKGGSATLRKIETIGALREFPTHIELDIVFANETGTQQTETLRGPVLIGADGSNGQTRRLATALGNHGEALSPSAQEWYTRGFALEALIPYTALPQQLPAGDAPHDLVFDFSPLPGGYGWLFPKGDHINIGVGAFAPSNDSAQTGPDAGSEAQLKAVTRSLLTAYTQTKLGLSDVPNITGQHLGMGGHNYIPRGRILLTGDAAGLVDPLTGEGIHSAIVSGQAAAAAILETVPKNLSSRPEDAHFAAAVERPAVSSTEADTLAQNYARRLAPLQQTLAFSHRAARAFYKEPARGFRAMKLPFIRGLILKTYADGLPHTKLLGRLLRAIV